MLARKSNFQAYYDNVESATFYIHTSAMATQQKTIALIDDDAQLRLSLARLLTSFDYQVETFASAEEFLTLAVIPDCLVIDLCLGIISGLELAQHAAVTAMDLPVIIMSGTIDDELWRQALALKCAGYLRKPFSPEELLQALKHAGV
jgi:FixJ family two-component response regulator